MWQLQFHVNKTAKDSSPFAIESRLYLLKTLIEIDMVISTNSGSFPSNSHVSATFSIFQISVATFPSFVRDTGSTELEGNSDIV